MTAAELGAWIFEASHKKMHFAFGTNVKWVDGHQVKEPADSFQTPAQRRNKLQHLKKTPGWCSGHWTPAWRHFNATPWKQCLKLGKQAGKRVLKLKMYVFFFKKKAYWDFKPQKALSVSGRAQRSIIHARFSRKHLTAFEYWLYSSYQFFFLFFFSAEQHGHVHTGNWISHFHFFFFSLLPPPLLMTARRSS